MTKPSILASLQTESIGKGSQLLEKSSEDQQVDFSTSYLSKQFLKENNLSAFRKRKTIYSVTTRTKKCNASRWSLQENLQYAQFLRLFESIVTGTLKEKRKLKQNRMMSKFMKTRSASQCRSHHQKMLKAHQNVPGIIEHIVNFQNSFRGHDEAEESEEMEELLGEQMDPVINSDPAGMAPTLEIYYDYQKPSDLFEESMWNILGDYPSEFRLTSDLNQQK